MSENIYHRKQERWPHGDGLVKYLSCAEFDHVFFFLKKKNLGTAALTCNHSAEEWEQKNAWGSLASLVEAASTTCHERPFVVHK